MSAVNRFAFGPFELDLLQRELRRDGLALTLSPRLFDLLSLLVAEHHRVVPRDEILARLWAGRVTSAGVLPQAILKLRAALGDEARAPWIKGMRGVGYRFMHPVHALAAPAASAPTAAVPASPPSHRGRVRVGILPCLNQTDDPRLQWLCLGLPAMTAQVLDADPGLALVGTALLANPAQAVSSDSPEDPAQRALQTLGLDVVVQGRLTRQAGLLWLHGDLVFADGRRVPVASLRGPNWQALSMRWAQAVQQLLDTGPAAALVPLSPDPFALEAFARGTELMLRSEFTRARPLLQVVYDLEPEQPAVRLALMHTLVMTGDAQAVAFGSALVAALQQAEVSPSVRAQAHLALSMAHRLRQDEAAVAAGQRHLELALEQARGHEDQDWALMVRSSAALAHGVMGQRDAAIAAYDEVARLSRRAGNLLRLGDALTGAAVLDYLAGRLPLAHQRLEEAMGIWERVDQVRSAIQTEVILAVVEGLMGRLLSATEHANRAAARLCEEGLLTYQGPVISGCALVLCLDRQDLPRLQQLQALFGERNHPQHPLVETPWWAVQGLRHLLRGEDDAALQAWQVVHAKGLGPGAPGWPVWRSWTVMLLRVAARRQRQALVDAVWQSLQGLPRWHLDIELQAAWAHVQACQALADGQADRARTLLADVAAQHQKGREPALAALDLAWLHLDDGRADLAQALLSGLGPWCDQHPLGRLVRARLCQARGCDDDAAVQHAAALALMAGPLPPWARAWPDARQPAPRLPLLLSASHFAVAADPG